MKFQTVLAAIFAFVAVSAKKGYQCGFRGYNAPNQLVNMNNRANSNANALAINNSCFGDANAFSQSAATNANCVNQNQGGCY